MPPIGAAPRMTPASPTLPINVDFVDTGPAFKKRLKSFLTREPPPDRHAAYLESLGHEHPVSRSRPISPPSSHNTLSRTATQGSSSIPSSPNLSVDSSRRPGVALSLSVSADHLPARKMQPRSIKLASSRSTTDLVPPRSEAPPPPNCPLPPLPLPLPHITAPPPSPPESLESAIDANVLRRYSTTARSSQSSSFSPLHERLLSKSRDLLALSVSSIWSLSVEDDKGISTDYEEEEDANAIAEARRKASLSLEGLSLSLSIPSEDEDLLGSPSETSRPSLSTSSSSDSTQTERIKFLSVFDREPNLRLSPPGTTSSPSVSPRTQSTDQFGSNTSALDAGDEEDYRNLLRNTPGAFCWTPTEEVSLSELEKQKLEKLMKQKVRRSTSKAKVTM